MNFPWRLHLLLDEAEIKGFSHVVSWLERGTMFKVHKTKEFADRVMPCYFQNQTRYKSFQRQLNSYRFHRFIAGNNKGACFHALFMKDKPDLCTHINRAKVTRRSPDAAQQQTLLMDDHALSPKAPRGLSIRESLAADVPDDFLRMFNSTVVDPLECPSVTIFDDEEEGIQLSRTTLSSATTATHALQQEDMGDESEFQDTSKSLVSLSDGERPQKTKHNNALIPQYVQFPGRNKNFDYSSLSCASNDYEESSKNTPRSFNGGPSSRGGPQGWLKRFEAQSVALRENNQAAMNSTMGSVFEGASQTLYFMDNNVEFEEFASGNQNMETEKTIFARKTTAYSVLLTDGMRDYFRRRLLGIAV
jgi:hypothetical protein